MRTLKLKVELFRLELIESLTKVNNYHFKDGCIPRINIGCIDFEVIKINNGYVITDTNESIKLNKLGIEELIDIVDCINI